ncbi:tryptophan-rich sensory protein [Candidatus Parcubacteria bacterium]|uniref:Tryptophan-rich sensory protein n=1 Tax=Candidatus Kaiserbacteria bacterium CG10_big_fil_rev_8_21_14_0_10_47_16 TaxID=1974608 RepID=A0A2H0UFS4_9BACT|nr:tryptophan-rich sensory protein [Candidatus Parcubacteria bacterium]PIR84655.1 MAG: tryptophan-rich sensory protein [Candidatus Kaiserbacteria bacterium CG10_big_fil_rev_8_21_14_0_10_47_16]
MGWYASLVRPSFAPPAEIFGPVWSVLYIIIALSFGYVFYKVIKKQIPTGVALPFVVNLFLNLAFTPVQFGLHNLFLASIIIIGTWLSLIWMMVAVWPHSRKVAYAQIPYFLWVSFATVLQLTITFLN